MFSARVSSAAALLLTSDVPALAQSATIIVDFLGSIDGDTSPKTIGSDKNPAAPLAQPLTQDVADIVGYRFFKENMGVKKPEAVGRARIAFAQECQAKAGRILTDDDPIAQAFHDRRAAGFVPKGKAFHVWTSYSWVCTSSSGQALGGLVAISERKGYEPSTHNGSSQIVGLLMPSYVRTAVYAYHPRTIVGGLPSLTGQNRASAIRPQTAARFAEQRSIEVKRDEAFRAAMEVGSETNCGTVIQVRGPMVEVAVPPMRTAPGGQPTFWSRRTVLFLPGPTICTFGL